MLEKSMQAPSSICGRGTIMAANASPRAETHSLFQGRRDLFLPLACFHDIPRLFCGFPPPGFFMTETIARLRRGRDIFFREHIISSGFSSAFRR
ncbi:hypothetical protein RCCGEPOP_05349 [Rhizobium sp. Pop5]|nr:hypothetical protein RCCGEPOP_05349 [Rhizobium sp. Pop5]